MEHQFGAPWGTFLRVVTALSTVLLLSVAGFGLMGKEQGSLWQLTIAAVPLLVLLIAPLFMVRGYLHNGSEIQVQRLFWQTPIPLAGLHSVVADPVAMKGSIRTFGNGGLFSITGRYRNKRLGSYRAFATDAARAVVLHFADSVIVLTPDDPEKFVATVAPGIPNA